MAKKIIKTTPDLSYKIVGIISTQKDYKLAWILNNLFSYSLVKLNDFESIYDKFNFYKYQNQQTKVLLIENKNSEGILIDEFKKFNFILKIFNSENIKTEEFISILSSNENIDFCSVITSDILKQKTLKQLNQIDFE